MLFSAYVECNEFSLEHTNYEIYLGHYDNFFFFYQWNWKYLHAATMCQLYSHSIKYLQVPIVNRADDGQFPGFYCTSFLSKPWLSDGCTMILSSY